MEPHILASQLRCPKGEQAPEVARRMNEANAALNRKCIEFLQLKACDSILEVGPGNGAFVTSILNVADNLTYAGVDWSAEMVAEAEDLNAHLVKTGRAHFLQGSSEQLPFEAKRFDKVLAVHTLYFWEKPADHLAEICRVMKPASRFCIAFGDRSFMKDLPFAPYGFRLYDEAEAIALLRCSGFQILEKCQYQEKGLSNTGDPVDKFIHIVVCGV